MKSKKRIATLVASTIGVGVIVGSSMSIITNDKFISNQQSNVDKVDGEFANSQDVENPIIPVDQFYQSPILVEKTGPIVSYGNKITALDWFAGERWEFDFGKEENIKKYMPNGTNNGMWDWNSRNFISWSLDTQRNLLWLLTSATASNKNNVPNQNLIGINSIDGSVKYKFELKRQTKPNGSNYSYYESFQQIAALKSGKVLVYSGGNKDMWSQSYLCDPVTQNIIYNDISKDFETLKLANTMVKNGERRWQYLVPIADNINIAILQDLDASYNKKGTNNLYMMLVDDNMHVRKTNCEEFNNKLFEIKNNWTNTSKGYANIYNKSYFYTLDNRVYYTAYDKFFVFKIENDDIKLKTYNLKGEERISSFAMDVNENVYYKLYNDTKIYKMIINSPRTNFEDTTFDSTVYYNIDSYTNQSDPNASFIRENAKNFIIYNVSNYSGSLMMLKAREVINGGELNKAPTDNSKTQYGLSLAITPNQYDNKIGDSLGSLNGQHSFQKSADFDISDDILKSKIPSEITENDLTLLNGGFLTENKTLENNQLKYKPFEISNIKDSEGKFTITANIDQIPWFTNSLPSTSIPKKIVKEFSATKKIKDKISWKENADNDYNFKNTLPSKISEKDLNDFDPFQVSFNSKEIVGSNGNVIYPKKTYTATSRDDKNGTLDVNVKYEYVPLGKNYTSQADVLVYEAKKQYKTFDIDDNPTFNFVGQTSSNESKEINIKNVPELKNLSQANLLPSSFKNLDKKSFEQFINTNKSKGYPLSRMDFSIEADDLNGKLTITAKLEDGYYENKNVQTTFKQVYVGLNKISSYSFSFKNNLNEIGGKQISTILPSSINEGDVLKNFINYTGFNSSDFTIKLFPNNDLGTLDIEIYLSKDYAPELGNISGFSDYKISKKYTGFMTSENYNRQYEVMFKTNADESLASLKKLNLQEINTKLVGTSKTKPTGLTIDGVHYDNLNELTQKLLVSYVGSCIPNNEWVSDSNIKTSMIYNNNAGTMSVLLNIKKDSLNGLESDLNIIASYSGFAKGNLVETSDNLSFLDNDLLKVLVPEASNMSATEFGEWLQKDQNNLRKIISTISGEYDSLLTNNQYKLVINANDAYKTISIDLIFDSVTDNQSLKRYSTQYVI